MTSNTTMLAYYIKLSFYYVSIFVYTSIFLPLFVLRGRSLQNLILASKFYCNISWLLGLKYDMRGTEHMEKDENFVIVANHQSSLDVIALCQCQTYTKKTTFIAKSQLRWSGPFGAFLYYINTVFVKGGGLEGTRASLQAGFDRLKHEKVKFWFYPEGARYNTGQLQKFKKGAFHFAIENKMPILPIVHSHYYFLDTDQQRFDNGTIIIKALPPIPTKHLNISDVDELLTNTKKIMEKTFNELNQELRVKRKNQ